MFRPNNKFIECVHGIKFNCKRCEHEMMQDFVVHNVENMQSYEVAQCIKEGIISFNQLDLCVEARIAEIKKK